MGATTVRVSERAHGVLRQVAEDRNVSMTGAVDLLAEAWEKQRFFQAFHESFAALKADPDAWEEEQEERRLWDQTLNDHAE